MESKVPKHLTKAYPLLIILAAILMGIGYASSTISLDVTGTLIANAQKEVAITNISCNGEVTESHVRTILDSTITLSDSDLNSSVTCTVTVRNNTNDNYAFKEIVYGVNFYDNYDIRVSANIPEKTPLNKNQELSFTVTFKYKDDLETITNNVLNSTLNFKFEKLYTITYENITNHNYPTGAFPGENITVNFEDPVPREIELTGSDNYTYSNGVLTINNITNNIIVTPINLRVGYFKSYDGSVDIFGFPRTITSFSRNTDLTLEQVQAKSGVQLISNVSEDQYNSEYPVYGWVENDNFYWWSEADIVYFHPDTLKAFKIGLRIITIDLNGTSTEKVKNFAHWFDTNKNLTTISGRIVTTGMQLEYNSNFNYRTTWDNDLSSEKGMAFMFNDCNSLQAIDLSGFDTTNASDMKRMFGGCKSLTSINMETFNTSNVKSMHWMFRQDEKLTNLDLSNFDTRNVENMFGMFVQAKKLKTITLGNNFETTKVKYFTNMFYDNRELTTIYAKKDFTKANDISSSNMFYNDSKLVGGAGYSYETPFSSDYIDATYAQIASPTQSGYFTLIDSEAEYSITYNLDGGSASNPTLYQETTETFTLNNPTKTGYDFIGWTGSNGSIPQMTVSIQTGSIGNKVYTANYTPHTYTIVFDANGGIGSMDPQILTYDEAETLSLNTFTNGNNDFMNWNTEPDGTGTSYSDGRLVVNLLTSGTMTLYAQWGEYIETFPTVFAVAGPCKFNGKNANITGENCKNSLDPTIDYTTGKYIDTGIKLYDSTNYDKDYEIYFEIDEYKPSNQDSGIAQQTMVNTKLENSSLGYPGLVFRRSGNDLEVKQTINNVTGQYGAYYTNFKKVRIVRRNKIVYYSINGGELTQLQDLTNSTQTFSLNVTIGAAMDKNNSPFRYLNGTLSNIHIKLGEYHD